MIRWDKLWHVCEGQDKNFWRPYLRHDLICYFLYFQMQGQRLKYYESLWRETLCKRNNPNVLVKRYITNIYDIISTPPKLPYLAALSYLMASIRWLVTFCKTCYSALSHWPTMSPTGHLHSAWVSRVEGRREFSPQGLTVGAAACIASQRGRCQCNQLWKMAHCTYWVWTGMSNMNLNYGHPASWHESSFYCGF